MRLPAQYETELRYNDYTEFTSEDVSPRFSDRMIKLQAYLGSYTQDLVTQCDPVMCSMTLSYTSQGFPMVFRVTELSDGGIVTEMATTQKQWSIPILHPADEPIEQLVVDLLV